jgi:hypothetical protein
MINGFRAIEIGRLCSIFNMSSSDLKLISIDVIKFDLGDLRVKEERRARWQQPRLVFAAGHIDYSSSTSKDPYVVRRFCHRNEMRWKEIEDGNVIVKRLTRSVTCHVSQADLLSS